jgi:hypothetical protein
MRPWVLAVLFACGGSPPPAPIANAPATEPVTCHDASVILRGPVSNDDVKAGPARENAILRACEGDHWSAAVLACIGSARSAATCTDKLTTQQRENLEGKLGTWDAQYGGAAYGGEEGGVIGGAPDEKYTDCAQLIDDVSRYAPPFDDKVPERDWQVAARKKLVEATCNREGWTEPTKECVLATTDPVVTESCLKPETSAKKLAQELTELDATASRIAAAKKKPRTIACDKVVAAHYGDAHWKDRLKDAKATDRKKLIAASRAAMQKACTDDQWSETMRACVVVSDGQRCYESANVSALRWGYPALIAVKEPGMPDECATYKAVIERVSTCEALPVSSREAMKQAFAQTATAWTSLSPDDAKALGPACQAGADSLMSAFPACSGW